MTTESQKQYLRLGLLDRPLEGVREYERRDRRGGLGDLRLGDLL